MMFTVTVGYLDPYMQRVEPWEEEEASQFAG